MSLLESSHRCHQLLDRFHFQGFLDSMNGGFGGMGTLGGKTFDFDFTAGPSLSEVVPIHWNPPQRCFDKELLRIFHSQIAFGGDSFSTILWIPLGGLPVQ